jgi:hypothetical protein
MLTGEEHKAMDAYQTDKSEFINDTLRGFSDEYDETMDKLIDSIDNSIGGAKVSEDLVVYRGLKWQHAIDKDTKLPDFRRMEGLIYEDKGFMSTTYHKALANSWASKDKDVVLKLYVPKGTNGFHMGNIQHSEHELLLGRDTKVRILRTSDLPNNRTLVEGIVE